MTTLAATRAKMGSTTDYLAKMKASQLSGQVQTARDAFPDWDNLTIEERIQRELNKKRVLEEIVPYLNESEDRFFGSLIVLVDGKLEFEPISEIAGAVPKAYEGIFEDLGALTISTGRLIALDGQHRLVALRAIVQGEVSGKYSASVIDDEVSVVFIQFESLEKTRRIFNKVNRYARSTSRSDNLVLSEDDGAAYIARRLFMDEDSVLSGETSRGETLVNWKNSTLSGRSQQFTTLSALYETVKYACKSEGLLLDEKSNSGVRPSDVALEKGLGIARTWWEIAVSEIDSYKSALTDPSLIPQLREPAAKQSLLMKPAGQIVLFRSAAKVLSMASKTVSISEFFKRANKVDWCMESPMWDNIFVLVQSKIMTKEENQSRSANLIAYLVAHNELANFPDFLTQVNSLWAETHPNTPLPKPLN